DPASHIPLGHLLVCHTSVGERNHPIDHGRLEGALVEERCECVEQGRRCSRIAVSRVGTEQPALIMIEVNKVKTHPAITHRCDLDLSAAMSQSLQRRLEHRTAHSVEDNLCTAAARCASNNGIEGPVFEDEEIVDSACRGCIRSELMTVHADDVRPTPFPNLCCSSPNASTRANHQQALAGSELSVFNYAEPSGEIGNTDRR